MSMTPDNTPASVAVVQDDDASPALAYMCMAAALEKQGNNNAAHYMRTAAAEIAKLKNRLAFQQPTENVDDALVLDTDRPASGDDNRGSDQGSRVELVAFQQQGGEVWHKPDCEHARAPIKICDCEDSTAAVLLATAESYVADDREDAFDRALMTAYQHGMRHARTAPDAALRSALAKVMPIATRDTRDYAEVTFGTHETQAMTMHPEDWQAINNAYFAPLPSKDEGRRGESGWLIEHQDEPKWLTLRPAEASFEPCWTNDSLQACRFARRADAEDYVSAHFGGDGPIRITEHQWVAATPSQKQGEGLC